MAQGANPAATATPEPLLDPPGVGDRKIPRVPWRAAVLVGAPAAHCELDRVGLANHDQPCRDQAFCKRRRIGRAPLTPHLRTAGRNPPFDLDQIFECDRDPVQRADAVSGPDRLVGRFGDEPGLFLINLDKGVQFSIRRSDPGERGIDNIDR